MPERMISMPITIRIRMALSPTAMPLTIPSSISFQECPRATPSEAATMLATLGLRIEACGFGIEDDFAHLEQDLAAASAGQLLVQL